MRENIATHEQPPDADFLIRADLAPHGMAEAHEQLWVKRVDKWRFLVRSIPFFTYGISLNDEVETDATFLLAGVLRPSGHRLLRVAVDGEAAEEFHSEFHPMLDAARLLHEWRGLGYVSIDLPPERDVTGLREWLDSHVEAGHLHYEGG